MTNKLAKSLLPPDSSDQAYQKFCNAIKKASKKSISGSHRSDHLPCWDAKCESLFQTLLPSPEGLESSRATTELLNW